MCKPNLRQSATSQPDPPAKEKENSDEKRSHPDYDVPVFPAATLFAQTENHQLMTVKVPFSFSVQDHSLPAGEYNIFTVLPERAIRITSTDGRYSAIVNTLPNYARSVSESSRLAFHRYGDEYLLAEVWIAGQDVGRNPMLSKPARLVR